MDLTQEECHSGSSMNISDRRSAERSMEFEPLVTIGETSDTVKDTINQSTLFGETNLPFDITDRQEIFTFKQFDKTDSL